MDRRAQEGRLLEPRANERTLLAVMLLHANETVSNERLIDEIWGARPPASAVKLLATYGWQLRKSLGGTIRDALAGLCGDRRARPARQRPRHA